MTNTAPRHTQKLWSYCKFLRDDGLSYGDCLEQWKFLLLLKMADDQSRPPFYQPLPLSRERMSRH
jgi:type I restriction enzyme M protein